MVFDNIEKQLQQLTVSQFTDTFVISHSISSVVIQIAFLLQRTLLVNKLVSRGAITYGEIYHKSHRFIGPAINEAYSMETKEAMYPRIIISNNAFNKLDNEAKRYIKTDKDGYPTININTQTAINDHENNTYIKPFILEEFKKYKDSNLRGKYHYLARQFFKPNEIENMITEWDRDLLTPPPPQM